eukprot:4335931-Amphidinium_carterae.1
MINSELQAHHHFMLSFGFCFSYPGGQVAGDSDLQALSGTCTPSHTPRAYCYPGVVQNFSRSETLFDYDLEKPHKSVS